MTVPGTGGTLPAVVGRTKNLLVDFDGPLCSVFAGYPASQIAQELRDVISGRGFDVSELADEFDPLQVLRFAAGLGSDDLVDEVAGMMGRAELMAVETARPTPGARDVLEAALSTGRRMAVASNNSREAVTVYLDAHGLRRYFTRIIGRYEGMNPAYLKPSNHLIGLALIGLGAPPWSSTIVGDSATDIEAARSASVASIGYANKPGKEAVLADAGADAIIGSMSDLALALQAFLPIKKPTT